MYKLYNDDCLKIMDNLIEEGIKVDCILTDPPYGTTRCKWDSIIPFDEMWERINKLIKDNGAVILFGSEPFSSALRMSNIKNYKYDWVWNKKQASSGLNAKYQPLKIHENIIVFSKKASTYSKKGSMIYNPQGLKPCNIKQSRKYKRDAEIFHTSPNKETIQKYKNYPVSIITSSNRDKSYHPTQKPVDLLKYLIKTYTNEGDIVLDFTMGSGSTGVACKNLNRNFIGIELDEKYFNIAKERIENI